MSANLENDIPTTATIHRAASPSAMLLLGPPAPGDQDWHGPMVSLPLPMPPPSNLSLSYKILFNLPMNTLSFLCDHQFSAFFFLLLKKPNNIWLRRSPPSFCRQRYPSCQMTALHVIFTASQAEPFPMAAAKDQGYNPKDRHYDDILWSQSLSHSGIMN